MSKRAELFKNDIGIDLGTANTRVFVRGKGRVLDEPTVVAIQEGTRRVLAAGEDAMRMLAGAPGDIVVIRPMKHGVVADADLVEKTIRSCIAKVNMHKLRKPRAVIAVPGGIAELEKRAVRDSAIRAGAREVFMIEAPMAAAIGAGLPVTEPAGTMVVDIGAGTTEIALISLAGIVASKSLPVGGDDMDEAVVAYVRERHDLLIGERTAGDVKVKIGSAWPLENELEYEIKSRAVADGKPVAVTIDSREIREEALDAVLDRIVDAVKHVLADLAPPAIAADLADRGVVLTGGGALLKGLDRRIAEATQLPVRIADDPLHATIHGIGRVLEELDWLAKNVKQEAPEARP